MTEDPINGFRQPGIAVGLGCNEHVELAQHIGLPANRPAQARETGFHDPAGAMRSIESMRQQELASARERVGRLSRA